MEECQQRPERSIMDDARCMLEKALNERGIQSGANVVVLQQGLLAQLPIWLGAESGDRRDVS